MNPTIMPLGAKVYLDGTHVVTVVEVWPEGSTSYQFPHYQIRDSGELSIVALSRIGVVKKFKNPYRICAQQVLENNGFASVEEAGTLLLDSVMPACCTEGCDVEPDGRCEHGCPSLALALGII